MIPVQLDCVRAMLGLCTIILVVAAASGADITKTITVDQKGQGDFTTVQAAIDSVPENNVKWIRIHVKAGTYKEKVRIPISKPFILLEGEGKDQTVIVWGDSATPTLGSSSLEASSTIIMWASDFVAKYISFKNSFQPEGTETRRAVAAMVAGDRSSFYHCGFYGLQDTLNDYLGKHLYSSCYIEGIMDFIFGFAQSLYQDCDIVVRPYDRIPMVGFITAQGRRNEQDPGGFVFERCRISGKGQAHLGRAWRSHSRVIFSNSTMSEVIVPQGWDNWRQDTRNIFYAEHACTGKGSNTMKRVNWERKLTQAQVNEFEGMNFINKDKWIEKQNLG